MTLELVLILVYLALQLGIGVWVSKRIRTEADYLIAGRQLGYTLATFSIFATWFGAETVVGAAGNAYRDGVSLGSAEPFGYALCLVLMGAVFAVPLWKRGLTTLADLFRIRYSVGVERVAAIILIPSSILWAAAQVRAFGHVISVASGGWDVDVAIGIAAAFTILYTMFGGLLVDAITDVIQGIFVLLGLVVLLIFVSLQLADSGGIANAIARSPGITLLPTGGAHPLAIAETWAIPVFGSVLATELVGRVIATRNPAVARRSPLMAAGLYLFAGIIPVTIGLLAIGLDVRVTDAEQVIPVIARELMPTFVYAVFVGAFISAILSTVDSTLLTASGLLSHNLIVPLARVTDERVKVRIARAGVLCFGLFAYMLALTADGVYELVEQASALGSSGALVVICFGLFTRFGGRLAALYTLLVGTIAYSLGALAGFAYPFITSVALSVATYLVIGRLEAAHRASELDAAARSPV
jgi:solute:Na+ symporter, SSS family